MGRSDTLYMGCRGPKPGCCLPPSSTVHVEGAGPKPRVGSILLPAPGCGVYPDPRRLCRHTCAGNGNFGQLGIALGNTSDVQIPTRVASTAGVTFGWASVSAGQFHTCGIAAGTRAAYCWGAGGHGRLGIALGNTSDVTVPTPLASTAGVNAGWAKVSAGQYQTCGIAAGTRTAYCWGASAVLSFQREAPAFHNGAAHAQGWERPTWDPPSGDFQWST